MMGKPKRSPREKDLTSRYLSGNLDEDRVESQQRFTQRNADAEQNKILRTSAMRASEDVNIADLDSLPIGQVIQVHSLFSDVMAGDTLYLCTFRKTLSKVSDTAII